MRRYRDGKASLWVPLPMLNWGILCRILDWLCSRSLVLCVSRTMIEIMPGAAGSEARDRLVGLGRESVVDVMMMWMGPNPGHRTRAAMTMGVRVKM